jgi:hypothetical protein
MWTHRLQQFTLLFATAILMSSCGGGGGGGGSDGPSNTGPSATITADRSRVGSGQEVTFTVSFSEDVTGFDSGDVVITGGSAGTLTASGDSFTMDVTAANADAESEVTFTINSNTFNDLDGASNPAATAVSIPLVPTWTMIVYGHGDHNLSHSLAVDISEMGAAAIDTSILRVLVVADWKDGQEVRPGGGDAFFTDTFPTGYELYGIMGNGEQPVLLDSGAEPDFDDPSWVTAIVQYAAEEVPSDRYGLVMWDHGWSWFGGFGGDKTGSTSAGMDATSIAAAIQTGFTNAGVTDPRPLTFFGFDTCLMATPSVIHPLKNIAEVYIACAELDFGDGWDYTETLEWLSTNPGSTATEFGAAEVGFWNAHHEQASDLAAKSHVAIDLLEWDAFATATETLVTSMLASSSLTAVEVGRHQFTTGPGYHLADASEGGSALGQPYLRDLGQFLAKLSGTAEDATVASAASSANTALESARLGLAQGLLRNTQSGVHCELALVSVYNATTRLTAYSAKAAAWCSTSNWDGLLAAMFALGDSVSPVISGSSSTDGSSVTIDFSTADIDIAEALIQVRHEWPSGDIDSYGWSA